MVIINETPQGIIFKCDTCHKYHIEYKNINFNFTQKQLDEFIHYLSIFDFDNNFEVNKQSPYHRKIMLSVRDVSCNLLFHKREIKELYFLLTNQKSTIKPHDTIVVSNLKIKQFNN